jgi:hypothetical protein
MFREIHTISIFIEKQALTASPPDDDFHHSTERHFIWLILKKEGSIDDEQSFYMTKRNSQSFTNLRCRI